MSNAKCHINAVLFDLGETILNFGRVDKAQLFRSGAHLSYDFLKSLDQPAGSFKSYCLRNLFALRFNALLSAITGNDFDSLTLLKKIGIKKGYKLDQQQWEKLVCLWYQQLKKIASVEPDIAQTLGRLKKAGLKLGILSNTFVSDFALEKHLQQLGILDFFSVRMFSYQFDFRKPDIRIFKAAADRINENCENILFVGDRLDNDIRPALKIKMHAALKTAYTNRSKKNSPGAWKIDRLSELPDMIQKSSAK
jgi:HAD superfamily hydrolase (TIGR01549 family)